jgi:hypothetical protein
MRFTRFFAVFFLTLIFSAEYLSAQKVIPDEFCVSLEEQLLFDKLNLLRKDYGKPAVDFSKSLSYVAKLHVEDLLRNHPDTSVCNLSSWSDKGEWTACCYNPYVPNQDCMWDKPKELTPYTYRGYELAGYFEGSFTVDSVINLWSNSKAVLDMLLTEGNFKEKKWICMGLSMNQDYVSVWFGQRADKMGEPDICTSEIAAVKADSTALKPKSGETFYLIFGAFSDPKDAKEAVKRYKKNGFEEAGILKSEELTRVYLGKYDNLKEAMFAKQQLSYTYREAWIFKE